MAGNAPSDNITGQRIRRGKGIEHIRREALQDTRISFKAQGILTYLLSLPDNWKTNAARLSTLRDTKGKVKEGRESIQAGLRELEAAGYLRRDRACVAGRWAWHWTYTDNPDDLLDDGHATEQQEHGISAGQTMDGLHVNGPDQAKQDVSAGHSINGLTVDGSPVDIERRDHRDSEETSQDQKIQGSAGAPSAQAQTDYDPWDLPSLNEPLPPPNYYTEPLEWIEYKVYGFDGCEQTMADSMLCDGQEAKKILAKILKDREGVPAVYRSAIKGNWLPYVKRTVGGWRKGEYDYARKLLADYHPDIVVEELRRMREQRAA